MFAKDYRNAAWEKLSGNWGVVIGAYFVMALINGAAASLIPYVGSYICVGALTFGFTTILLAVSRKQGASFEMLFEGFTKNFVNNFLTGLLQQLFITLWTLLFVIPGVVKTYSYAMTFYVLKDNPEMSANEAITESRKLMDGNKWRLFCLDFSYIGWILLSFLTCGVLMLWVVPYMQQAHAEFYESIKPQPTVQFEETVVSE